MPVIVAHGARPGPTIWLDAAIHGDELNGVEVVRRVLLAIDAGRLAGTILAVPIVNVFGVTNGSRYMPDGRDLNRSFPGSRSGSLAARLARTFFEGIALRCQFGLDLHSGSRGRCNLPSIRCDIDQAETRRLADAFCAPIQVHANLRDGSLRAAAHARGIPVLLYEAGEAMRFDHASVQVGVDGALRVMQALGMIADAPPPTARASPVSRSSKWSRASRSGFAHVEVDLGQEVSAGQHVATIFDAVDRTQQSVRARTGGIVIGVLRTGIVHRGDAIVHVAEVEP